MISEDVALSSNSAVEITVGKTLHLLVLVLLYYRCCYSLGVKHVPFLVERRKISLIGHRVSASKAKDPSHWITECQWPIPILLLEKQIIMNLPEVFSPGIKTNSYVSY